jgi:hypothetical protein
MAYAKRYSIVEDRIPQKLGPQPELIVRALMDKPGQTVKEIAARIKSKLVTRQDPERVVNFYMSTWKKKGIVSVVEVDEETPVSTGIESQTIGAGDIASVRASNLVGPSSAQEQTAAPFDFANATLKDSIVQLLKTASKPQVIMDLHHNLQVAGRSVRVKAVADSVSKLVREGLVSKDDEGKLSMPSLVSA